ncbi:hypothetical protein PPL_04196 [Heterostelium album PN500]|uniref:Uncharacterized protein n=1 Tax=Heterostelium pallidum (strain ATCC 26659 / Pp 5 / PN500) TaxID=670386 RepID=D3B6W5_HETP5|nr:hypothetical protein PPL_04196 [Heterostelium album PN500]EFA82508.1 hypothetical protein PPL_04196 [Heterostelium album PN500]|eukprot:XP_020434625.1 hypothetical protein PPL_04196 [Heterostelium album PN500]
MVKIISVRSLIVYANFLLIPTTICLLWLLLPIDTYTRYSGTSMVYFVFMFFTWISFYDLNLPGCSKIQIVVFYAIFIAIAIGWLNVVTKLNVETNRMSYSFIDAIAWLLSSLCYFIHILVHKIKKQYYYQDDTVMDGYGIKRRKRRSKPWTKRLSKIFCYYKRIDMDEEDQRKQMFNQQLEEHPQLPTNTTANVQYLKSSAEFKYSGNNNNNNNSNSNSDNGSQNNSQNVSQKNSPSTSLTNSINNSEGNTSEVVNSDGTVTVSTVVANPNDDSLEHKIEQVLGEDDTAIEMTTTQKKDKTKNTVQYFKKLDQRMMDRSVVITPFLALVSIVVFHLSRLLLSGISNALNRFLKPREIKYFTFFQFPMMFFLYYRNLFLSINSWGIAVLVSFALFAFDIFYYLLHMTKRYWFFRHQGLIDIFDRHPDSKFCRLLRNTLEDQNPSYDQHVRDLSVEYYYDKMAEYVNSSLLYSYSIISWISIIPRSSIEKVSTTTPTRLPATTAPTAPSQITQHCPIFFHNANSTQ